MASVSAAVVRAGADLGVIFDTDVDRAGCVDAQGREINRNRLVALGSGDRAGGSSGRHHRDRLNHVDRAEDLYRAGAGRASLAVKRGSQNVINEATVLETTG